MRTVVVVAVPVACLVALCAALSGCGAEQVSFQATSVSAAVGGADLARNDEIAIHFSEAVDPASVTSEALRVTDASGRRVTVRVRTAHDAVLLAPAEPEGWPADARLTVEVPHPWLGRPIRSVNGDLNDAPFRTTVTTGGRYTSRGGSLRLTYHSLPASGAVDVTNDAEFLFEFDGPLDPATLDAGVTLADVTRGEERLPLVARVVGPRRLSVAPFLEQGFRSGTRFRLVLTGTLGSLDARRLGEPKAFVFTTTRSHSGEHITDFRAEHLADPSLKPEAGPLTPQMATTLIPLGSGVHDDVIAAPFGAKPSRIQVLISKHLLGPENAIITAMSFDVLGATPAALSLEARLDYAADYRDDSLGAEFEGNWNLPATRMRDLLADSPASTIIDPTSGKITFVFTRPFFYEANGRGRSLVLEVVNETGTTDGSPGVLLRGQRLDPGGPVRFVASEGDWPGEGTPHAFAPAIALSIERPRPVPLKPWATTTVSDPEYFRRQDHVVATPGFFSFEVQYRPFEPGLDPLSSDGYSNNIDVLDGHTSVQARVVFLVRSADAVPKDAGLIRLTVPFRVRGE